MSSTNTSTPFVAVRSPSPTSTPRQASVFPGPSKRMSSLPAPNGSTANGMAGTNTSSQSGSNGSAAPMARSVSPMAGSENGEVIICNGCKDVLDETGSDSVVVSFGNQLWHVNCFRCAKCQALVEHDTNLLLLADGSPVCENCSYICSVCKRGISNEAIVTGDESYHAECFRCRTCANRIEELIFAKTSQGIYCMSCHNERVTRSRRHAEAKRGKTVRRPGEGSKLKEKSDHGGSSSTKPRLPPSHSRTKSGSGSQPPTPSQELQPHYSLEALHPPLASPPPLNSADTDAFPSPALNSAVGASVVHARQKSLSEQQMQAAAQQRVEEERMRRTSADELVSPIGSPSKARERRANSVSGVPPSLPPKDRTLSPPPSAPSAPGHPTTPRTASVGSSVGLPSNPAINRARGSSTSSDRPVPTPPGSRKGEAGPSSRTESPVEKERAISPLSRPSLETSHSFESTSFSEHRRKASKDSSLGGLKPLGLTAPNGASSDRINNRRSGFYGFAALPPQDVEDVAAATDSEPAVDGNGGGMSEGSDGKSSPATPPVDLAPPMLPPIHDRPMSFYDPDTLLFLDAVASPSSKAFPPPSDPGPAQQVTLPVPAEDDEEEEETTPGPPKSRGPSEKPRTPSPGGEIEHLSPVISSRGIPGSDDSEERKSEALTRKVRQSIMVLSRNGKEQGNMGMDVALVEQLLAELDSTKEKMKTLQSQYSAMKRASRTAFEGFNAAREEYDKEVAARREAEAEMEALKSEMLEQATRLSAAGTVQSLQRESQELRSSVHGLQRALSTLTVERDLKIAEVETLQKIDTADASASQLSSIPRSLSSRLDTIKQGYKAQIDQLIEERDNVQREVEHWKKIRDGQVKEIEDLNRKSDSLAAKNAHAQRELEEARALLPRTQARAVPAGTVRKRHQVTDSPSLTNVSNTGSATPSPSPAPSSFLDGDETTQLPPEVNIATHRKFKWGKSSAQKAVVGPPTRTLPPSVVHRPNPSTASAGEMAMNLRAHNFQPVSILRPVRCEYCGDKLWGLAEVRCSVCGSYCHSKCAPNFYGCSVGQQQFHPEEPEPEGPSMFGNELVAQARLESVNVPRIVSKCIEAVEYNGLQYEGIYRKTGGMSQVKMVQACFDRGTPFDLHDMDRFNDISAVTSALKNYFRQLPNPLFTYELHEAFVDASKATPEPARLEALEKVVYQLSAVHFHTLSVLMRHLHRVHLASDENKMNPQNLGVVFGPTLLRSQNPSRQFSDMPHTAKIVELLVEHTTTIFRRPLDRA